MLKKSSNTVVITVSDDQFKGACANVVKSGNDALSALTIASKFIAQSTNKKEQDTRKKAVALAWIDYQKLVEGKTIKLESAQKWVARRVKALAPKGFKWLVSNTAKAKSLRAARAGGKTEAPAKAPAKAEVKTIDAIRNAIIAKEKGTMDLYRNVIPSGKLQAFEQAYMAFISTLNNILV